MMTEKLPLGVYKSKAGKFRAAITVRGKQYHLGTFSDVQTAERVFIQNKKMVDDILTKNPESLFNVPRVEYIEVPRPSVLLRIIKRIRGE